MTPQQKLKLAILIRYHDFDEANPLPPADATGEQIDALYEEADDGDLGDAKEDIRCCGTETDLQVPLPNGFHMVTRNYEYDHVATETPHGWIGFVYWHGGGKHSEPSAIDWIEYAYDVNVTEEEVTIIKQTFTKPEPQ